MSKVSLTVELAQNLDIKGGRLYGIMTDPHYQDVVKEYDLDANQSLLWFDVVQILNSIMELYEYENVELSRPSLGKVVRRVMKQGKFPYLKTLITQDLDDETAGTIYWEIIEDIQLLYDSIQKEKKIFITQEEINRIVEEKK